MPRGGFDAERFPFPSVEDVELGLRLSAQGARIGLDPSVRGKHLKAWSFAGHGPDRSAAARRAVGASCCCAAVHRTR